MKRRFLTNGRRGRRPGRGIPVWRREIEGLLVLGVSVWGLVDLAYPQGSLGRAFAAGMRWSFGVTGFGYLLLLAGLGLAAMKGQGRPTIERVFGGAGGLLFVIAAALGGSMGGRVGLYAAKLFVFLLGPDGMRVILGVLGLGFFAMLSGVSLTGLLAKLEGFLARVIGRGSRRFYDRLRPSTRPEKSVEKPTVSLPVPAEEPPPTVWAEEPAPPPPPPEAGLDLRVSEDGYRLPSLALLSRPERRGRRVDMAEKGRVLEETLRSFGVAAKVVDYIQGPMVTRYELQPAPGVKVSRIVNLADDLALAMAAPDIRIEAPIPGKAAVGVEVPNPELSPVYLREVLESQAFQESTSPLTVALGKDIGGEVVVTSLDRMPHLLIAGATGAGKSVSISTIIASLLFKATPSQVKLLLIDPKVVELSHFNGIPHLLTPVVTDPKKAAGILRAMVHQMEERYDLFAKAGVRDIEKYNQHREGEERLPYVVVVIDELADLMMVSSVEVEDHICRLAQMARAAGIHMVVATQRPSVDVITGLIKANIPSRIAFAVSSQVDSRTILDAGGAEKLLGRGDMLFAPIGAAKPIRLQGAYVSEREMENIIEYIRNQSQPAYLEELERIEAEGTEEKQPVDELFPEAVKVVMEAGQASASFLQRKMRIGYSRAARLVDAMEERGIVGPAESSKPREVRISAAEYHRLFSTED